MTSVRRPGQIRPRNRQSGFSLLEMTFSTALLSLLLVGVIGIYTAMMRLCASVTAASFVSADAANAVQRVSDNLREAQNFELMDGIGAVDGVTFGTTYDATDTSTNAVLCVTGIRLFAPAAYQSAAAPRPATRRGQWGSRSTGGRELRR